MALLRSTLIEPPGSRPFGTPGKAVHGEVQSHLRVCRTHMGDAKPVAVNEKPPVGGDKVLASA